MRVLKRNPVPQGFCVVPEMKRSGRAVAGEND